LFILNAGLRPALMRRPFRACSGRAVDVSTFEVGWVRVGVLSVQQDFFFRGAR
jgi:hypothetical protein